LQSLYSNRSKTIGRKGFEMPLKWRNQVIVFLLSMILIIPGFSQGLEVTGRPVRIVSIGFPEASRSLEEVCALVSREAALGSDLILLPETWTGHKLPPETMEGPTIAALSKIAREHHTYIVCPLDRMKDSQRLNSAILIDRKGEVAGFYDKVFPYWSEYDLKPPVEPGHKVPVFQTDFGRLGITICFDVNFPEVWQALADQGAELVVWPSAYSAGMSLQAHAINHHYYIVTATNLKDCLAYDITGENILTESSPDLHMSRITLDLDRGIYHENFNSESLAKLLKEHSQDIEQEKWLTKEQWFVLKARRPGVSARSLAKEYGLEELRDYINRSRREIDRMRGSSFLERGLQGVSGK
jgi:predicted amidohydrolase